VPIPAHSIRVGPVGLAWSASVEDRPRAFLRGRALVAELVGEWFPEASGWTIGRAVCRRCGKRHGPVELTGVRAVASVSYTRGLVVAALAPSDTVRRLGVDVERDEVDASRVRDLEQLIGSAHDPALRRWTRIEAVLKADGRGLLVDPADVTFDTGTATILGAGTSYSVTDVDGPAGFVLSLAWCDAGSSAASCGPATS